MHSGCLFIGLLLLIGSSFFEGELTAVATGCGSANYLNLTEIHLRRSLCPKSFVFLDDGGGNFPAYPEAKNSGSIFDF